MADSSYYLGMFVEYDDTGFHFEAIGALNSEVGHDACTDGTGGSRTLVGNTNPVEVTCSREVRDVGSDGQPDTNNIDAREATPIYKWVEIINSGPSKEDSVEVKGKNSDGNEGTLFTMKGVFPIKATTSTDQRGVASEEITFFAQSFEAGEPPADWPTS